MDENRKKLISLIHAQKTAAHLTEDEYRMIIAGTTDHTSCTQCSYKELWQVFNDLNVILERKNLQKFYFHPVKKQNTPFGMQGAVIARARKILGTEWQKRLNGFLEHIQKKTLAECNNKELRQIMGMISTVERTEKP